MRSIVYTLLVATLLAIGPARADRGAAAPGPLVDAAWLEARLDDAPEGLAVVDLRGDGAAFEAGRIPGARWSPYPRAGWLVPRDGVVAMAPDARMLQSLALGLDGDERVILIAPGDHPADFGAATRVYWTLRQAGHRHLSILKGGFRAWEADPDRPLERGPAAPIDEGAFEVVLDPSLLADDQAIETALAQGATALWDARSRPFFEGERRHGAAGAPGRLPGAEHLGFGRFFDPETGALRDKDALEALLPENDQPAIAYCNVGHLASIAWFVASEVVGRDDVRLYDRSMVGWTQNPENPVETGAP